MCNVLIVEDNEADFQLASYELSQQCSSTVSVDHLSWATSLTDALRVLREERFDVVLLDYSLPDTQGLSGLRDILVFDHDIPVILFTGYDDEAAAVAALQAGAQDYLIKGAKGDTLLRAIRYALERNAGRIRLEKAEELASAASKAKSEFLANMSHEIRTPLTSIIGFTETLLQSDFGAVDQEAIASIHRNGDHLLRVINDILDFSKIEAGHMEVAQEEIALLQLLNDFERGIKVRATAKALTFRFDYQFPLPTKICSDETRIRQILFNIVGNAIKFTEVGEVVVEVSCDRPSETLTFRVKDTGIGLTEEEQSRLFQAFSQADSSTTRNHGGTGLGLVLAQLFATKLGGGIALSSKKGEGSIFTITLSTGTLDAVEFVDCLPFDASLGVSPGLTKLPIPDLRGRILLAEDCPDTRSLIQTLLLKTQVSLVVVNNGEQAVQRALAEDFDLVLMDMQMPLMDGYRAVEVLRQRGYTKPIIAFTASVVSGAEGRCRMQGCNDYIRKPFRQEQLYRVLGRYVGSSLIEEIHSNDSSNSDCFKIVRNDPALAPVILQFIGNLAKRIGSIDRAFKEENWEELKQHAHRLIAAGNFGYPELSDLADALEGAARSTSQHDAARLIDQLKTACSRIESDREVLTSMLPH